MSWITVILSELFGLFVDDGLFAASIVIWIGGVWLLARRVPDLAGWQGPVFFCGLALILVESAIRRARQ